MNTVHAIPISIAVFPPGEGHSTEWIPSGFVHFGAFLWLSELLFGFGVRWEAGVVPACNAKIYFPNDERTSACI